MQKTEAAPRQNTEMRTRLLGLTKDYSSIIAILVMGAVFTVASPYFPVSYTHLTLPTT